MPQVDAGYQGERSWAPRCAEAVQHFCEACEYCRTLGLRLFCSAAQCGMSLLLRKKKADLVAYWKAQLLGGVGFVCHQLDYWCLLWCWCTSVIRGRNFLVVDRLPCPRRHNQTYFWSSLSFPFEPNTSRLLLQISPSEQVTSTFTWHAQQATITPDKSTTTWKTTFPHCRNNFEERFPLPLICQWEGGTFAWRLEFYNVRHVLKRSDCPLFEAGDVLSAMCLLFLPLTLCQGQAFSTPSWMCVIEVWLVCSLCSIMSLHPGFWTAHCPHHVICWHRSAKRYSILYLWFCMNNRSYYFARYCKFQVTTGSIALGSPTEIARKSQFASARAPVINRVAVHSSPIQSNFCQSHRFCVEAPLRHSLKCFKIRSCLYLPLSSSLSEEQRFWKAFV